MYKNPVHYYLATGNNGIVIKSNYPQATRCRTYLRGFNCKRYDTFEEAEDAALEHLSKITPFYIPIPDSVRLNEMITVGMLRYRAMRVGEC